ncbi:hypothetical protein [Nocardioides baculatus]|uniref:hypothetical protein n=1 Tax=Nocardioides baculatus TaxID=2801337 RepID=UPI001F2C0E3E|nr:hypothetical protein [Nocardioides baculatus]
MTDPTPGARALRGIGPREGLRPGLVWPAAVDPTAIDGPTRGQARGPRYRKSSFGLYVPAEVDGTGEQRIVEAAATYRAGVVTGWAGLAWLAARWFKDTERPVPLALQADEGTSAQPHLVAVTQEFLHPDEVIRLDGLRITTALRSVSFEMRHAPTVLQAAQAFAMAAYDDLVSIEELRAYCATHLPRCTGVGRVREALARLTENAWSPTEVSMAWHWKDEHPEAGLLHNCPIFDRSGRHVATVDVLDPDGGVVGEYHGGLHLAGQQRAEDVVREERLRATGLEVVVMVSPDLSDPTGFLARLDSAYERAVGRTRRWTVEQPPWWTDTSTVEARRALTGVRRERLLRYRSAA